MAINGDSRDISVGDGAGESYMIVRAPEGSITITLSVENFTYTFRWDRFATLQLCETDGQSQDTCVYESYTVHMGAWETAWLTVECIVLEDCAQKGQEPKKSALDCHV